MALKCRYEDRNQGKIYRTEPETDKMVKKPGILKKMNSHK